MQRDYDFDLATAFLGRDYCLSLPYVLLSKLDSITPPQYKG